MPIDDALDQAVLHAVRRVGRFDDESAVQPDVPLADALGLSSLQLIVLLTQLCDAHGIDLMRFTDTDLRAMRTPREIAAGLRRAQCAPGMAPT